MTTNTPDGTYSTDMQLYIAGSKSCLTFNIPYYYSEVGGAHYIMFASIISTEDGLTTVTLSADQEEAVRDEIAYTLKGNNNAHL